MKEIDLNLIDQLPVFKELVSIEGLIIESGHLHADRNPSDIQLQTIRINQGFQKRLQKSGFKGKFTDIVMIDEAHVVNRLNYSAYLKQLEKQGFIPSEIIMESSPVIREIAIDVLKELLKKTKNNPRAEIQEKGGNLYLICSDGKTVELIEDMGGINELGCVLFDTAFTVYKKISMHANSIFNQRRGLKENVDKLCLDFYLKETSPQKRRSFAKSLETKFPDLEEIKNSLDLQPYLNILKNKKEKTATINVHEIFYQPQQEKVNRLLEIMNLPLLTTLYFDPQKQEFLLEKSR